MLDKFIDTNKRQPLKISDTLNKILDKMTLIGDYEKNMVNLLRSIKVYSYTQAYEFFKKNDISESDKIDILNHCCEFEFLDQSNEYPEKLSYLKASQYPKYLQVGADFYDSKFRTRKATGTLIDQLFRYSDESINSSEFSRAYKGIVNLDNYEFIVVDTLEDIKYYYDEDQYSFNYDGTLQDSCMRYCDRAVRLTWYADNNCKLAVLLEDDLVVARAIIWPEVYIVNDQNEIVEGPMVGFDRIYYGNESQMNVLKLQIKNKFNDCISTNHNNNILMVKTVEYNLHQINNADIAYHDGFTYWDPIKHRLYSLIPNSIAHKKFINLKVDGHGVSYPNNECSLTGIVTPLKVGLDLNLNPVWVSEQFVDRNNGRVSFYKVNGNLYPCECRKILHEDGTISYEPK